MPYKFNPFTGKLDNAPGAPVFPDNKFTVFDDGDKTKRFQFEASGISPSTTRTLDIQDVDGPVAIGHGLANQYIRGDATLANFPVAAGGGSSVSYYFNGSVSQGTILGNPYYEINKIPAGAVQTNFTINAGNTTAYFITDASDPNLLLIPQGNFTFQLYALTSSGNPQVAVELYKYDGATFTQIGATSPVVTISNTASDIHLLTVFVPAATTLALTDRLAVRVIGSSLGGHTITFNTEGNTQSQIITTFSTGLAALNGLTDQVQFLATGTTGTDFNIASAAATHTFNIPTASAANRGALSSSDWNTFNGKVNRSGDTMTGKLNLPASTTSSAGLNLGNGVSPTTSIAGDVFASGNNIFFKGTTGGPYIFAYKNDTNTFLVPQIISTVSPTGDSAPALRITQAGGGEALRVEDDTTPDSTAFVVSTTGRVGVGVAPDAAVALKVDSTGIKFGDNTVQTTAAVAGVTSVSATSPITSSGGATPAISIADAIADGVTKGAATFTAADFNAAAGVISIDYTNGQSASGSTKGFLTSADWTAFNGKIGTGLYTATTGLTMNTARLLGRTTAGTGAAEEITVGTGLSLTGTTLTATASGGSKTYAVFNAMDNQPPATAFATLDTRNSIAILDFDDATDENAIFLSVIPEAAILGSGLKIRLIWTATTATSGDCVWDAALERMNTDIDTDSFDTAASVTTTTNGTSGVPNYSEITLTTIDSVGAGDGFRLKITRDANNASDTMTGDAELIAVEVRSAA